MPWILITDHEWNTLVQTVKNIDSHVTSLVQQTQQWSGKMAAIDDALKTLTDQVSQATDAEEGAATLLSNLATLIQQNAGNPQAVTDLATKLKASTDALAAAITANTPAAPAAPDAPPAP
jgi:prophage DNA circulation protein